MSCQHLLLAEDVFLYSSQALTSSPVVTPVLGPVVASVLLLLQSPLCDEQHRMVTHIKMIEL